MHRLVRADAFDDRNLGAIFRGEDSPGGARRLDRIDGIDDRGVSKAQLLLGQRLRDRIGRDPRAIVGQAAALHRRFDRIDGEQRKRKPA